MNILFVKIGAIGDAVMARTLPALAKQRYPDGHFTWMAGRGIAKLVGYFQGVDEVLEVDDKALLAGNKAQKVHAVLHAWRQVALRRFDAILVGHGDWRFRLLSPAPLSPRSAGISSASRPFPGRAAGMGTSTPVCCMARTAPRS